MMSKVKEKAIEIVPTPTGLSIVAVISIAYVPISLTETGVLILKTSSPSQFVVRLAHEGTEIETPDF